MKILGQYQNGDFKVTICEDGTKYCIAEVDDPKIEFAESIDVRISNTCDGACPYCYDDAKANKPQVDILNHENHKWLKSLHPFTEVAINGNDLSHPQLEEFLRLLKGKDVICNMTVNGIHLFRHKEYINYLVDNDSIKGLGVSIPSRFDDSEQSKTFRIYNPDSKDLPTLDWVLETVKSYKNGVLHYILGVHDYLVPKLKEHKDLKILILGYKEKGRGQKYIPSFKADIMDFENFKVTAFDCLAVEQLELLNLFENTPYYQGADGTRSFYIDMVNQTFAVSSTVEESYSYGNMTVDEMFNVVKGVVKAQETQES